MKSSAIKPEGDMDWREKYRTYNPEITKRAVKQMLEAAEPCLFLDKFSGMVEVPTTRLDRFLDIIRFKKPSKTKRIIDRRKPFSIKKGDTVKFRRLKPFSFDKQDPE